MQIDANYIESFRVGSAIAEDEDEATLERYFIETGTYRAIVKGDVDIISGVKGAGKTALYKMLAAASRETVGNARIVEAVNPAGDPVFSQLPAQGVLTEAQFRELWRIYILSLVGNDLLWWFGQPFPDRMKQLDELLKAVDLRSDEGPKNILSKMLARFRNGPVKRIAFRIEHRGDVAAIVPEIEFHEGPSDEPPELVIPDAALDLLEAALTEAKTTVWCLFDRLDEAFRDHPDAELPALRALLRIYVDFKRFEKLRVKIFVRSDLFRRLVTVETFVNLTHVTSRKREISWDTPELQDLVYRRFRANEEPLREAGVDAGDRAAVMQFVLPGTVRSVPAFDWITSKLADGTGHVAPRNLIDLLRNALAVQSAADGRDARTLEAGTTLLTEDALGAAYEILGAERLVDTVLAEADPQEKKVIESFRRRGRTCTQAELRERTGLSTEQVVEAVEGLVQAGAISKQDGDCRIPELYVEALEIRE